MTLKIIYSVVQYVSCNCLKGAWTGKAEEAKFTCFPFLLIGNVCIDSGSDGDGDLADSLEGGRRKPKPARTSLPSSRPLS